jgi:outer membrane protein
MRVLVLLLLTALSLSTNAQPLKIGFIDTDQIITNLSQYKESVDAISFEFEPKKQELLDLFKHIELLKANIESNKKIGNSEPLKIELSKLKSLEESFKKETEFWQIEINRKKVNLLTEIENLINKTINDFALKEGYDLILYKDVVFASDKINITKQIIEKIEKQSP